MKPIPVQAIGYRDFIDPNEKDTDWILRAVKFHYSHGGAKNLLYGKNIKNIKRYASGDHPMDKFRAMFPSPKKPGQNPATATDLDTQLENYMGIDMKPLGVLQQPLANAIATIQKSLTTINFDAIDPTANANREMDMERLRNRPQFEAAIASAKKVLRMPLEPVGTSNNTPTVDISTLELDPSKPDELNLYANLFYKLRPESAFEVVTEALMYMNDFKEKQDLERRDQVYYGVSCNRAYMSDITGLPIYDYVHPRHVYTPDSDLPDFSDQPFRYIEKNFNIEQILNAVGRETISVGEIQPLFEKYWKRAGYTNRNWETASEAQKAEGLPIVYMEFKSFDVLKFAKFKTAKGRTYTDRVPFGYNAKESAEIKMQTKWPQQTYYAYWAVGTDKILKSGKVLGTARRPGKESISRFTIQIYKSKDKSDVEQAMSIVDDIQRAYIKLQQTIIMAKPPGQFFDMKYLRNAAESMADDVNLSIETLLHLFTVHNVMVGDTTGMDAQNEGQFLPVRDLPGGLREAAQYIEVIKEGHDRLARITGWNDAMTGQAPNPDGLVGLQKLLLQSAQNSLHYALKASKHQTVGTIHAWAPMIQYICEPKNRQTEARKALESIVGARKIDAINDMDALSVHQFGIRVEDAPNEYEQDRLHRMLEEMVRAQRIELSDFFLINRVLNYKDAEQLLIIREKKKAAEIRKQMEQANQAIIQAQQIRTQGDLQGKQIMAQGEIQEETTKIQGAKELFAQKAQLELMLARLDGEIEMMKKAAQGAQAVEKTALKHNLDQQKALP